MQIKAIYQKLHQFVSSATSLDNEQVIFATNALTRPKKPFITISAGGFRSTGMASKRSDNETMVLSTPMVFTASFMAVSDVMFEAEELLDSLRSQLATELPNDVFAGDIAMRKVVKPTSVITNHQVGYRAILELEFGYTRITRYQMDFIKTIEIDGEINNQAIKIKKEML